MSNQLFPIASITRPAEATMIEFGNANRRPSSAVTAIWFNEFPGDSRVRWDPTLIADPRVEHFWDSERHIGLWFAEHQEQIGFDYNKGPTVWDSYLVFGSDATWEALPTPLTGFGTTVLAEKDGLVEAIRTAWDE